MARGRGVPRTHCSGSLPGALWSASSLREPIWNTKVERVKNTLQWSLPSAHKHIDASPLMHMYSAHTHEINIKKNKIAPVREASIVSQWISGSTWGICFLKTEYEKIKCPVSSQKPSYLCAVGIKFWFSICFSHTCVYNHNINIRVVLILLYVVWTSIPALNG